MHHYLSITPPLRGRLCSTMQPTTKIRPPKYSWQTRSINPALYYFTNHHEANHHLARLPHGPIGFDLEWRPNIRKGQPENRVALVQLATADTVILLHIHLMTRTCLPVPPSYSLTLSQNFQANWQSSSTRPPGSRQASAYNVRNPLSDPQRHSLFHQMIAKNYTATTVYPFAIASNSLFSPARSTMLDGREGTLIHSAWLD